MTASPTWATPALCSPLAARFSTEPVLTQRFTLPPPLPPTTPAIYEPFSEMVPLFLQSDVSPEHLPATPAALHSGYAFRTRSIMTAQAAAGMEVRGITGLRHTAPGEARETRLVVIGQAGLDRAAIGAALAA